MKTGLAIIGFVVVALVVGTCVACVDDDDEHSLGRIVLISHDRDECYNGDCDGGSGNEGEYRDDNRRAGISPGPFDRSPVDFRDNRITLCFPFANCRQADEDQPPPEGQRPAARIPNPGCLIAVPYHCDPRPASLFPPTPDGIKMFVLSTIQAGIDMGRLFADTTITFVSNLLVGIA